MHMNCNVTNANSLTDTVEIPIDHRDRLGKKKLKLRHARAYIQIRERYDNTHSHWVPIRTIKYINLQ